jgi:hypothetical protein
VRRIAHIAFCGQEREDFSSDHRLVIKFQDPGRRHQVSDKDQRAPEPEEQKDVEGHMRGRIDEEDEMRGMRGMRAANDEEKSDDDVEGHMRAMNDEENMRGMRAANDEDDVEGHMRGQNTP